MTILCLLLLITGILVRVESRGIIAVLQKASKTSQLQIRNQHLDTLFYREGQVNDFDVVIFCEHYVNVAMQEKLQQTSKLPLIFVFVDSQLRGSEKAYLKKKKESSAMLLMNTMCPSNGGSNYFPFGYKAMCQFWFADFQQYVKEYDWLLRVDDDCDLLQLPGTSSLAPSLGSLFPLPAHIPFAPAMWFSGEACSVKKTVTGLLNFTQQFATAHNLHSSSSGAPRNISAYTHLTHKHVSGRDSLAVQLAG